MEISVKYIEPAFHHKETIIITKIEDCCGFDLNCSCTEGLVFNPAVLRGVDFGK
jgi:hypothetical protein